MLAKRCDSLTLYVANILNFVPEYFFQSIVIIVNILLKVLQMIFIGHNRDNSRNEALREPSMKILLLYNNFIDAFIFLLHTVLINLLQQFILNFALLYCSSL